MKVKMKMKMKRILVTIEVYSSVICGVQATCQTTVYMSEYRLKYLYMNVMHFIILCNYKCPCVFNCSTPVVKYKVLFLIQHTCACVCTKLTKPRYKLVFNFIHVLSLR